MTAFAGLPFTAAAQQTETTIVSTATTAITPLKDSASFHKAGYFAIGFGGGVKDLTPFQGQHWLTRQRASWRIRAVSMTQPNFFMYLPVGDSLIPIGALLTAGAYRSIRSLPVDLAGVTAEWHSHIFCRNVQGEGTVLADGPDDCKERGGTAAPNQIAMVHTVDRSKPGRSVRTRQPRPSLHRDRAQGARARDARRAPFRRRTRRELWRASLAAHRDRHPCGEGGHEELARRTSGDAARAA